MNTSSIHRWLADGFIAGEQVTPGAPWQIRITDELRARVVQQAPPEYLPMLETNPVYAGAYTYGKTRYERFVDENGTVRKRIRYLPMD